MELAGSKGGGQSTTCSSTVLLHRSSSLTPSTSSADNRVGHHVTFQAPMTVQTPASNHKDAGALPKTICAADGLSLSTITFCLPSPPHALASEVKKDKENDHEKSNHEPDRLTSDDLRTKNSSPVKLINAIITSPAKSTVPSMTKASGTNEFAELLKSCKITIKPVEKNATKKASSKLFYSSARWRYLSSHNRTRPCRLKWHHTNFDDNTKKSRKQSPKSVLSDVTPLAQAWLEQATRDRATAETLRTTQSHLCTPISPSNDPCLVSASNLSDAEVDLPEIDASKPAKTCCDCRSSNRDVFADAEETLFDHESCKTIVRDAEAEHPRYRKRRDIRQEDATDTKQSKHRKILPGNPNDFTELEEHKEEIQHQQASGSFKMKGKLKYFAPKRPETFQNEQQVWNYCPDNLVSTTNNIFIDLFGESPELFNEESVNDIIMDGNFSFFDIEGSASMDCSDISPQEKSMIAQPTTRSFTEPSSASVTSQATSSLCTLSTFSYPSPSSTQSFCKTVERSSSYDHPGCFPEELICNSDTDSGIHSPGVMRSPLDDAYNWKSDFESHDFEAFFRHPMTLQTTISSEATQPSSPPSSDQEPHLLNMDDQQRYAVAPKEIFLDDPSSRDTVDQSACAQGLKFDYILNDNTWSTLVSEDNRPTTGDSRTGNFQVGNVPPSPSSSPSSHRKPMKASKRPSHSKYRRSSEKGKSSPHLWEFIRDILLNPKHSPSLIKWEDREAGVFRFVQSDTVAAMWGKEKHNAKMTYEKLSRAMRYYYNRGILERVDGRRLVYKFGPTAHGWKNTSKAIPQTSNVDSCLKQTPLALKREMSVDDLKISDVKSLLYKATSIDNSSLPSEPSPSSLPSANVLLGRSIRLASA